jgi:hypothetical protein
MPKGRSFPTSRWGFPVSLEVARWVLTQPRLTLPPQAFAFRKPCGSFSTYCIHRSRGSCERQRLRVCTLVKHASAFTRESDLSRNPQTLFRCQGTAESIPSCNTAVKRVYLGHGNETYNDAAHRSRQSCDRADQGIIRLPIRHSSDPTGDQDGSTARDCPATPL